MTHKKNYDIVSKKYRSEGRAFLSQSEVEAYYVARMPATLAAVTTVFEEVQNRTQTPIKSVLDLGAGLGAASMAARSVFGVTEFTLIESNEQMIGKGKNLIGGNWVHDDICKARFTFHDLVVLSYSFGEVSPKDRLMLLKRAWESAKILVVVEPGTPRGYETILGVRDFLIEAQGHLLAPCPHRNKCPLKGGAKWCHFSVRLQRTKEHRAAKGGQLAWEDEKFSYVAFSKDPGQDFYARIIGVPQKHPGHVVLPLCAKPGLEEAVVSKKEGAHYRWARKTQWGDTFDFSGGQGGSGQGPS